MGFLLLLLLATLPGVAEQTVPLRQDILRKADAVVESAIKRGRLPGGVLWIEHRSQRYQKAYG